jgi:predicted  nucleic acid-binding Zn-ribbon protein
VTDRFDWILAVPPECPSCEHVPMKFVRRREYATKSDAAEYRCPECGTRKVTRESEEEAERRARDAALDAEPGVHGDEEADR